MRLLKTGYSNQILTFAFFLLLWFSATVALHAESKGKIEQPKIKEVVLKTQDRLEMVADVFDEFGGDCESDNLRIWISSSGQPSPIGTSEDTAFTLLAGYVYAADTTYTVEVPSMSQLGMIILLALIIGSGIFMWLRKREEVPI